MGGFYSRDIIPAIEGTPAEEDAADVAADAVALVTFCRKGCLTEPGGTRVCLVRWKRSYRVNGVYAGGAQMAVRKYACPACGEIRVVAVQLPTVKQNDNSSPGHPAA